MINLLPYQEKKLIQRIMIMRVVTTTLVVATILAVVGGLLFLPTLLTIGSRYDLAQSQISRLEQEGVVTSTVNIADLEKRTTTLEEKFAQVLPTSPIAYVTAVRQAVVPGITLVGYTLDKDQKKMLTVTGIAANREVLQSFANTLQTNDMIASIDNPIVNYVKSKDNQFTISVVFK